MNFITYQNCCGIRFNVKSYEFMNVSVKSLRIYTWNLGLDKSAENHKQKYLSFS